VRQYYVVPIIQGNKDLTYAHLIRTGKAALIESLGRIKSRPFLLLKAISVEVYTYNYKKSADQIAEYAEFPYVCFINEGAMRMYRDKGMSLNVQKVVPADELPKGMQLKRSFYVPA
jgi:hypothetical protein